MSAIHTLLAGLIDYAGLYPPAGLDMRTAIESYRSYSRDAHSFALGRFVVGVNRLEELREAAGNLIQDMPLSVVAPITYKWNHLALLLARGFRIEMVEVQPGESLEIQGTQKRIPAGPTTYYEVTLNEGTSNVIGTIASAGGRAKIRTGGIVAQAFPSTLELAEILQILRDHRLPFKATAGLHHPVRSLNCYTYAPDSASGVMHGFVNLFCAAVLAYFGGSADEMQMVLEEENPAAFDISEESLCWRGFSWTNDQIRCVREMFFISFGSCSFEEPIRDLEALEWL